MTAVQEVFTEPRDRLAEVEAERDRWAARVKELERRASVAVTALEGGPVYPKAARDIITKEQVAKLAANGCMIVASGEWVAREATQGEALAAWQSKAADLEVENAKLRAELKRLRGEVEHEAVRLALDEIVALLEERDRLRGALERLMLSRDASWTGGHDWEEALDEAAALLEEVGDE